MGWIDVVLLQGALVASILALGWAAAAYMRRAERLRRGRAYVDPARGCRSWPAVTVVLPVKGCRTHSVSNWTSHLQTQYRGQLEFIFVVDNKHDSAWEPLQRLRSAYANPESVKVLLSGPTLTCSQKIHNLVTGCHASSPHSAYILFLDDDVDVHPLFLEELVEVMETDSTLFMATGYPFDVPPRNASLTAYCVLVYHVPLLIAFSIKQRTNFVWGGCMLLRRDELLPQDKHGVLQAWQNGGYSDDLLLAALCTRLNLSIAVPSFAVFPQWLDDKYTWQQYLNYLHRQLYVLDTYANSHNRTLNHAMMAVHVWASWSWVVSVMIVSWQAAACVPSTMEFQVPFTATQQHGWPMQLNINSVVLCLFISACGAAQLSLSWMTGELFSLLKELSPKRSTDFRTAQFSYLKLWAGLLVESCLLPWCVLYTLWSPVVTWGGISYHKRNGKVARVEHHGSVTDLSCKTE